VCVGLQIGGLLGGTGIGNLKVMDCPEHGYPWVGQGGASCAGRPVYPRSYAINSSSDGIQNKGYTLGNISEPSRTILITERNCPISQGQTCYSCSNIGGPASLPSWHNGKDNYLFFDGHVEALFPYQTVELAASALLKACGRLRPAIEAMRSTSRPRVHRRTGISLFRADCDGAINKATLPALLLVTLIIFPIWLMFHRLTQQPASVTKLAFDGVAAVTANETARLLGGGGKSC